MGGGGWGVGCSATCVEGDWDMGRLGQLGTALSGVAGPLQPASI